MNKTLSFDLAIFDCDGVLVDSEPLANQIYVGMLGEFGHHVNAEQYLRELSGDAMVKRLEVASQKLNWKPPTNFLSIFYERLSALVEKNSNPSQEFVPSLRVCLCRYVSLQTEAVKIFWRA